jgi:hypothetical protein
VNNHTINHIIHCGSSIIPQTTIAKLTTSTKLAMATELAKPKKVLPTEYSRFTKVFSKEATEHVPPSQPYDYQINLNETFVPKVSKLYLLSPQKQEATETFLDENLKSGKICPSNSPQASPFFFIKKKDGTLCPCQDYRYLNEHTI